VTKKRLLSRSRFLEKEEGTVIKDWGGKIPICLVFPNYYHTGMSNLGFQLLYQQLNSRPDVVCERGFLPERQELQEHIRSGTSLLSLETGRPLRHFQIIAFSVPFENDYVNLLTILHLAKIPLRVQDRDPRAPLIMAGGAAVTLNPEPLASFIDLFVIGEGEELFTDLLPVFPVWRAGGRPEFLEAAAKLEGIYAPSLYQVSYDHRGFLQDFSPLDGKAPEKVQKRSIADPNRYASHSAILTPLTEFKDMFLVEVNRGCPRGCRYCAAWTLHRPFRNRGMDVLLKAVELALQRNKRIGLVGSALSDHPQFYELCEYIVSKGGKISFASIRTDAITAKLANILVLSGHQTVTIAPETGPDSLREMVDKGFTQEDIFRSVDLLTSFGINSLKLYFIIGLPTETMEDVEEIVSLTKRIRHHMVKGRKKPGDITLSINPFIPKAWTPLQWHPFEDVKSLKKKTQIIKKGLRKTPSVRVLHELPKWGYVQTLLSMGDRRVGEILQLVLQGGENWSSALKNSYVNPDFWVYRQKTREELFPWDFIDHDLNKELLWEQCREALGLRA